MKFKTLIRVAMLVATITSMFGAGSQVNAQGLGAQIIIRSTTFWDAVFNGTVNDTRYERWSLQIEDASNFTVTVNTTSGDLTPDIYLLDASETQIAVANGTLSTIVLTANQPAGDYYIQVQPQSGGGTYSMEIREVVPVVEPSAVVVLNPAEVEVGGTSTGTVMLNNIPAEGYASAEFTCTYNPALIELVVTVNYLGDPDNGDIFASYVGCALLARSYLAISCMTSALTRNQVIIFILSVVLYLFLILAGFQPVTEMLSAWFPSGLVQAVASVSVITHFDRDSRRGCWTCATWCFSCR